MQLPPAASGDAETDNKRKKGRVLAIHGPDVFVDVPGGRSQGVLPAGQFPDGPPAVGAEVEFHIEGYDAANGLLLLARQGAAQTANAKPQNAQNSVRTATFSFPLCRTASFTVAIARRR